MDVLLWVYHPSGPWPKSWKTKCVCPKGQKELKNLDDCLETKGLCVCVDQLIANLLALVCQKFGKTKVDNATCDMPPLQITEKQLSPYTNQWWQQQWGWAWSEIQALLQAYIHGCHSKRAPHMIQDAWAFVEQYDCPPGSALLRVYHVLLIFRLCSLSIDRPLWHTWDCPQLHKAFVLEAASEKVLL